MTQIEKEIDARAKAERQRWQREEQKVNAAVAATEKLRAALVAAAEHWLAIRPVSPSATYKTIAPPYARRNAAACLRAAALLAEVQR